MLATTAIEILVELLASSSSTDGTHAQLRTLATMAARVSHAFVTRAIEAGAIDETISSSVVYTPAGVEDPT